MGGRDSLPRVQPGVSRGDEPVRTVVHVEADRVQRRRGRLPEPGDDVGHVHPHPRVGEGVAVGDAQVGAIPVHHHGLAFEDVDLSHPRMRHGLGEGEAHTESADHHPARIRHPLGRRTHEQALGLSPARVHEEHAVGDDLVVLPGAAQGELAAHSLLARHDLRAPLRVHRSSTIPPTMGGGRFSGRPGGRSPWRCSCHAT